MMNNDDISFEILADGTIKIETSKISGANHVGAEALVREIGRLAGGTTTRARRNAHKHQHNHTHEHEHEHEQH